MTMSHAMPTAAELRPLLPELVLIGSAFALLMVKVFAARRVVFAVDENGRIAPMAGPSARRLGALLPGAARPASLEEARS